MAMAGLTLLLLCSRLTLVVTMKMTKWLYLREVLCCGCSTSTRPRVLLTTELVSVLLESILYHSITSLKLLLSFTLFYFYFLSYVLKGKFGTHLCKTLSQAIITTSAAFSVPKLTIAVIEVISGLTYKLGERLNFALYWPVRLVCMPF